MGSPWNKLLPKFYSILTIRKATAPEGPPNVESRGLVRTSMTVRFRRIFLVAARSDRGLLSERTAGAQPRRQERVLMPRSRHSFLRDEPALSCTADSGCGARQQSRRADERGAIGCAPGNEHLRPVRGEWRGKPEFEAVPAVAIAGGCEIGAVVGWRAWTQARRRRRPPRPAPACPNSRHRGPSLGPALPPQCRASLAAGQSRP